MIVKTKQDVSFSQWDEHSTSQSVDQVDQEMQEMLDDEIPGGRRSRWKWLVAALLLIAALAAVGPLNHLRKYLQAPQLDLIYYAVQRGELPIVVTERGNLESQHNIEVLCEVDEISRAGVSGTTIVWIIPNGTSVKAGDLLVELDSAPHQERLDQQVLDTDRARATQIQAEARHENQSTQNETALADAELDVRLAELEVEMFTDEESGTRRLEVEAVERLIDDVNNEIRTAQAQLMLRENEKRGIEVLFKLGYAGKSELDGANYQFLNAESRFATQVNRLQTQLATLSKLQTYDLNMQSLKLQGRLDTARRKLEQTRRNNEALLAQSQAASDAANQALAKEEERLDRYRDQLEKCKIYAPQDGMVAYAVSTNRWNRVEIREGVAVRQRQHLLSLPNLSEMQVKTAVHESVVDQIRPGLAATVRLDAFADRIYRGSVQSVAVLPDPGGFLSSDTKVYETVVTIDEQVRQLKPGMTAVVEIHVDRLADVISIPVQAVVQIRKQTWCYVDQQGTPVRRLLTLGRSNEKFVEILEGLNKGERVVLNPMAVLDESKQRDPEAEDWIDDAAEDAAGESIPPTPAGDQETTGERPDPGGSGRAAAASGNGTVPKSPAREPGSKPRPGGPPKEPPQGD